MDVFSKSGQFANYGVLGDAAMLKTNKGTFSLIVMSENGRESQQPPAFNHFGKAVLDLYIQ